MRTDDGEARRFTDESNSAIRPSGTGTSGGAKGPREEERREREAEEKRKEREEARSGEERREAEAKRARSS